MEWYRKMWRQHALSWSHFKLCWTVTGSCILDGDLKSFVACCSNAESSTHSLFLLNFVSFVFLLLIPFLMLTAFFFFFNINLCGLKRVLCLSPCMWITILNGHWMFRLFLGSHVSKEINCSQCFSYLNIF